MKTAETRSGESLNLRCNSTDLVAFDSAAELEGFDTRTAWILYHLRRQAKKTISEEGKK